MAALALVFSVVMAALGALGVLSPQALLGVVRGFETPVGLYAAAAIRLVFGVVLFVGAPESRAPRTVRVLGVVIVVAGLITPLVGLERATAFLDWWSGQGTGFIRAWAAIPLVGGLLLAYALLPRSRGA